MVGIEQSLSWIASLCTVLDSNLGGFPISRALPDTSWFPTQLPVEWLLVLPSIYSGQGVMLSTHLASKWQKELRFHVMLQDEFFSFLFLPLTRRSAIDSNLLDPAGFCHELALLLKCIRLHVSCHRFEHISLRQTIKMMQRKPSGWPTYVRL